ncbi:septal ring lytic transglycosylase RlpA family protein [Oceanisphaera sp.]|uniref:septal ring lytic transglycosylase RlpA family protein n=1 Tax=Oceanisphaera sp. TaxID=1929979 RepID=UPI003A932D40
MNSLFKPLLPLAALVLAACSSQPTPEQQQTQDDSYDRETAGGRYSLRQDKAPAVAPNLDHVKDAIPRYEPYTRQGNKDYNVWGQDYEVWQDVESYQDEGLASWYGAKFHGYHTSNGEVYDMYTMTAAHKNLPLPSFVRVTNQENGKQVIVRVNDRGPFHGGRVIDLSYAAAYKLGMLNTGTAPVKIELIKLAPSGQEQQLAQTGKGNGKVIQLLAIRSGEKARELATQLSKEYGFPARVERKAEWYRLQMGPIPGNKTQATLSRLVADGYEQAYFIN